MNCVFSNSECDHIPESAEKLGPRRGGRETGDIFKYARDFIGLNPGRNHNDHRSGRHLLKLVNRLRLHGDRVIDHDDIDLFASSVNQLDCLACRPGRPDLESAAFKSWVRVPSLP